MDKIQYKYTVQLTLLFQSFLILIRLLDEQALPLPDDIPNLHNPTALHQLQLIWLLTSPPFPLTTSLSSSSDSSPPPASSSSSSSSAAVVLAEVEAWDRISSPCKSYKPVHGYYWLNCKFYILICIFWVFLVNFPNVISHTKCLCVSYFSHIGNRMVILLSKLFALWLTFVSLFFKVQYIYMYISVLEVHYLHVYPCFWDSPARTPPGTCSL